jgi:Cd2+/Zn2+-exporting ATPase
MYKVSSFVAHRKKKFYTNAGAKELIKEKHQHDQAMDDGHDHSHSDRNLFKVFLPSIISWCYCLLPFI